MYDTVEIDDDAPIDDNICQREWQTHQESVGATYRVNSDGELLQKGIRLKDVVELAEDENPSPDQLEEKWKHLDDYNGPFHLNGMGCNATLMVWDGVVKETKFSKIDYDKIKEEIDMPEQ